MLAEVTEREPPAAVTLEPPPTAVRAPRAGARERRARTARWLAGAATAIAGALSIVSALTPDVPARRHLLLHVEPGSAIGLGHVLAAAGGLCLVGLGWGMLRGRRRAASVAIIVLLVVALVHAAKGLDYEEAGVALALAGLIYASRGALTRGSSPRPSILAATVAVAAIASAYALDTITLLASGRASTLADALDTAAAALIKGAWWLRSGEPVAVALDILIVLTVLATAQALRALLRPVDAADGHSDADHRRAADIVSRYAGDSLDPFALREDKAFFFAYGGLLAYRTLRETAVVSGDPIGPPGFARAIFGDFLAYAAERGWDVVVTGASSRFLGDYRALGLRAIRIGDEAVVDPECFSLEGRSIRKVRQSVNRVVRRGWHVEVVEGVRPDDPLACEIAAVEQLWRNGRSRLYGFAMTLGRLWGAPEDSRDGVYALARDPNGRLCAFIRFLRYGDSLSLDVMRRAGSEPNGLNEALVVAAIGYARERGLDELSLNFAGFAHIMSPDAALTRRQRAFKLILRLLHRRFQLDRLVRFNQKFEPSWRPRYLIYGARTHLPLAALRVLQAETYLRPPRCRALQQRWQPVAEPVATAAALTPQESTR